MIKQSSISTFLLFFIILTTVGCGLSKNTRQSICRQMNYFDIACHTIQETPDRRHLPLIKQMRDSLNSFDLLLISIKNKKVHDKASRYSRELAYALSLQLDAKKNRSEVLKALKDSEECKNWLARKLCR